MTQKHHFVKGALFFAGLFCLLALVSEVFSRITMKLDYNEPKVRQVMAMTDQSYEALYLGNSMVMQAVNPDVIEGETGISGFNLALGGAGFLEMELLLEDYLEKNQKPKLLVYGISINRGAESESIRPSVLFSLPAEIRSRFNTVSQERELPDNWLHLQASRLPVFRYRAAPERLLKYLVQGQTRVPTWINGHLALGFSYQGTVSFPSHEAGLDEQGLVSFLAFCRARSIEVVLIECPNSQVYNDSATGRPEVLAKLQVVAGSVPFISYNEDVSAYKHDDWVGLNHLSAQGARSFSKNLAKALPRHFAVREQR